MLHKLMITAAIVFLLLNIGGTLFKIMGNPIGDMFFIGSFIALLAVIILAVMTFLTPKNKSINN